MNQSTPDLRGLRVAAFESRRAAEMAQLIERHGGQAFVSPSMREIPLEDNPRAIDFAHRLITGEISVVVFLTGVGFRYLLETVARHVDRQRYLDALADIVTVARGPKPAAALRDAGLRPTQLVPAPNTWREVLATIDQSVSVANQTVALQEYGRSNASLIAGLEARGAHVLNVPVYRWALPEDARPLLDNVQGVVAGERDVVLFTSAHQVQNVFLAAQELAAADRLRDALRNAVVGSIGPTTSEMLEDFDVAVDVEPEHGKMGQLVAAVAARAAEVAERKRQTARRVVVGEPSAAVLPAWHDGPFMRACRHEPTAVTPVWLMRQAGRFLPEYRQIRAQTTFLELCKNPRLSSEVMCLAVECLGVDAAIIFSDLLPILEPMGFDLEFAHGEGPVIHNPLRTPGDLERVRELDDLDPLEFVVETVCQTRADLPSHIPLIGFAGAPFTLASYAIEGGSSRNYLHTKTLMYTDEPVWRALMERLARAVTRYLNAQVAAGVQCVQLFDSWVGCLGPDDYRRYVLPYVTQIVRGLTPGVPLINFATGNPALLPLLAEAGAAIVGVDWRVRLEDAWQVVGTDRGVQGNLDPTVLLGPIPEIRQRVRAILTQAAGRPGHIFNLGHGVLPQTPVEHARELVRAVHEFRARGT